MADELRWVPTRVRQMMAESERDRAALEAEPSLIDGLRLRRVLHQRTGIDFLVPRRWYTGWHLDSREWAVVDGRRVGATRVIVSVAPMPPDFREDELWVHASMSHHDRVPDYAELAALHAAAFGPEGRSHLLFVPEAEHVNIHEHVLHLWGRLDGTRVLPDFAPDGTI